MTDLLYNSSSHTAFLADLLRLAFRPFPASLPIIDNTAFSMNASSHTLANLQTPMPAYRATHPWPTGHVFESPGAHLTYRVIGPCCRLYDREQLPWPACRIQWHSKEPSWRRIGRRLIADMATRTHPSYSVEIVGQSYRSDPIVMTLYTETLPAECRDWWHTRRLSEPENTQSNRSCQNDRLSQKSVAVPIGTNG